MLIVGDLQNKELSVLVGKYLNLPVNFPNVHVFPDGERRVRILDNVSGKDVLLIKSTSTPVDNNIMELCFTVDALKKNGAKSVYAVISYLGYMRADHIFRSGEGVPLEVVVKMIEASGVDKVMLIDPHSIKTPEIFHIKVDCVSALPVFKEKIKSLNLREKYTLVSPDTGGIRRIKILSQSLGNADYAVIEKERDYETGHVFASKIAEGKVNKTCLIVDDMISSGKTIIEAVNYLVKEEVEDIYVFATHAVFSENASHILQDCAAKKIFVTDTIFTPEEKRFGKLEILSIAELITPKIKTEY